MHVLVRANSPKEAKDNLYALQTMNSAFNLYPPEETAQAKKQKERIKTIAAKYATTHGGTPDDESTEAVIFRSASGKKLGQWSKKMFRAS
jgi:hypothetical protein